MSPFCSRAQWVLSLMLVILLSGCGAEADDRTADEDVTTDNTVSEAGKRSDSEIAGAVEVRPDDLPSKYGSTDRFGEIGDLVDGYVTLDMCGADFPSEDLRTARHQVAYSARDGDSVSTETVAYESGGAQQAMRELRDAVANCPKGFVASNVAGQPASKARIDVLPVNADWQEDTLAMQMTWTARKQPSRSGVLIYQRRGDAFTAVYALAGPDRSAGLAARLASLMSTRITAAVDGGANS